MRVEIPGETIALGTTEANPTIGIIDYSRRVTDDFGVTTVVERGFARRMSVRIALPFDQADVVQQRLASLRASPALWVADDRFNSLSLYGFYKDFALDIATPLSFCTLTVEGLVEPTPVVDLGFDPAPDNQSSTLRLIQPVAMTDAALTAASVPEADHLPWSSIAIYAAGARVVLNHRIWESLVSGNVANPAHLTGTWLDVGPTNRWAMFDEALGTATIAVGSLAVTIAADAVNAVALLDVVAATVRVEAAGFDETQTVAGGAVIFLGVPVGAVMVTVTGPGTVSVGTMIAGRSVTLGLTEASPTAGIADFSRKEPDEFGEVTIVERAWAKRMSVQALVRTDAIDLVGDRIAAVRARPSLWIGDVGLDSLITYGFFKDFSIAVGDSVSKLSLSVEGLAKAAPLAPSLDSQISDLRDRIEVIQLGAGAAVFNQGFEPPSPPAKLNDLWFRPDGEVFIYLGDGDIEQLAVDLDQVVTINGEPVVFGVGGGWLRSTLSDAVLSAGGNLYFLDDDMPTATKVGDSWFETDSGILYRWSGTAWVATADRTAAVVPTIGGIAAVQIAADASNITTTPLPRAVRLFAFEGATDVSPAATFTLGTLPGGIAATINDTPASADRGVLSITQADSAGAIPVTVEFPGGGLKSDVVPIVRTRAAAPIGSGGGSGGGGGGGGGSAGTSVFAYAWTAPAASTHGAVTPVLTVNSGSGAALTFEASASFIGASGTLAANVAIKASFRAVGGSTWIDVSGEVTGGAATGDETQGYVGYSVWASGLLTDTDYEVVLFARRAISNRAIYWGGDATFAVYS